MRPSHQSRKLSALFVDRLEDRTVPAGWAIGLEGTNVVQSSAPVLDSAGNVYIAGTFAGSVDMDPGPGQVTFPSRGPNDIYLAKYSPQGALAWARQIGGTDTESGNTPIAMDSQGNVYLHTFSNNSPPLQITGTGGYSGPTLSNGYQLLKFDTSGNFIWNYRYSAPPIALAAHSSDSITLVGGFSGQDDFDLDTIHADNADILTSTGENVGDIFVVQISTGGSFQWARGFGLTEFGIAKSIALDSNGVAYLTGGFSGTVSFDAVTLTADGAVTNINAYVAALDSAGDVLSARKIGGTERSMGFNITTAIDAYGGTFAYVSGQYKGLATFGVTGYDPGAVSLSSAGSEDIFVSKLDADGVFQWSRSIGGTALDEVRGIAADAQGNVYSVGYFQGTSDFDPGPGTALLSTDFPQYLGGANRDVFLSKLDANGDFGWARWMGSEGGNLATGVAMDSAGAVFSTGYINQGTTPFAADTGSSMVVLPAAMRTFLVKTEPPFLTRRDVYNNTTAKAIPDAGKTTSTMAVSGGTASISDLNVRVSINHPNLEDLDIFLIAPNGARIELSTDNGGKRDGYEDTFFDQQALNSITIYGNGSSEVPIQGTFRPEGSLAVLNGLNANGNWNLEITDDTKKNTGSLVSWSLYVIGTAGSPLRAADGSSVTVSAAPIRNADLPAIVDAAIDRWGVDGITSNELKRLRHARVEVANLGGDLLGLAYPEHNLIRIDDDAARHGWFLDSTPRGDSEFILRGDQGEQGRIDLLSVLVHEFGHLLGHEDLPGDRHAEHMMGETLATGTRRMPIPTAALQAWVAAPGVHWDIDTFDPIVVDLNGIG